MARAQITLTGTAWGVETTRNGARYLRVTVRPGYRDRNGQWVDQPEQSYQVWPARYAPALAGVLDQIDQLRQDKDTFVDVAVTGEVTELRAYQRRDGQAGAAATINASAICVTQTRRRGQNGQAAGAPAGTDGNPWGAATADTGAYGDDGGASAF